MNKINYMFKIASIPGIEFLYGHTSFKDCKRFNNNLTEAEYKAGLKEVEDKIKAREGLLKKKSEKIVLKDKSKKFDGK